MVVLEKILEIIENRPSVYGPFCTMKFPSGILLLLAKENAIYIQYHIHNDYTGL